MLYKYIPVTNSFSIEFKSKISIIVDPNQLCILLNKNKNWIVDDSNEYPYYKKNKNKINLLKVLFKFKQIDIFYEFKNNNKLDLRSDNVEIKHKLDKFIRNKFDITDFIQGHFESIGTNAYIMKNPIWITHDNKYLMYCEKDTICILCEKSYKILKEFEKNKKCKNTWFKLKNGYIISSPSDLYIHQIITNYYGNGKGTKNFSVDHIDRNPLNNSFDNLRIANRKEQENNSKGIMKNTKRAKSKNSHPLPEGIKQDMLPKYVNINVYRGAYHMLFDKKENGTRYGLKMKMKTKDIKKELPKFKKKIKDKYSIEI
jgi:hypothetical protein